MVYTPYLEVVLWLLVIAGNLIIVIVAWAAYFRYSRLREPLERNKAAIIELKTQKEALRRQVIDLEERTDALKACVQDLEAERQKQIRITKETENLQKAYRRGQIFLEQLEKKINTRKETLGALKKEGKVLQDKILRLKGNL